MTDFSSISFSDISIDNSDHNLDSSSSDVDLLLSKLGTTLMEVKQLNGVSTDLFTKLSQLVRQTQQKLQTSRQQNLEAHRKCLQHIEILLFQQDYVQALAKIDYYKRQQLNNISFESVSLSQRMNCEQDERDIENINFQQAKDIITSQFADFNLKQRIWLKYALNEEQIGQQLTHVTHEEVQQAIFQNFRRQFQIEQEITQMGQIRAQTVTTPQKKNSKSASHLKNSSKNNKSNNKSANLIVKVGKSNQKSSGKLANPSTRSSQKRTCRKNGSKIAHQSATAKKINSPSPFVI